MNTIDRYLFAGFFTCSGLGCIVMSSIAVSIGDTFLAVVCILVAMCCALIVADALRYHGRHETRGL